MDPDLLKRLLPYGLALGVWVVGVLFNRLLLPQIARLLRKTPTDIDELALDSLRRHVPLWFLALGVEVGTRYAGLPPVVQQRIDRALQAIVVFSITIAVSTFLTKLIDRRSRLMLERGATSLIQNMVRWIVIAIGMLMVASSLGIAITPILTALGVGSLAVALALQPTLSNLFAGLQITLARHIRIGDYIELDGGRAGYVSDISWRSTLIRELSNNMVIVPNSKLSEMVVRNYALSSSELSAVISCSVSYDADLDRVRAVVLEVAAEVLKSHVNAVTDFEPLVRFTSFGDSGINFMVVLRVRQFADRATISDEFIRTLHRRFAAEKIDIPFPQRVVHMASAAAPLPPAEPVR
jgi:small-conductance mechanosensitive channel